MKKTLSLTFLFITLILLCTSCTSKFKPFEVKDTGPKIYMMTGVNQLVNGDFHDKDKNWAFFLQGGNATGRYRKNTVDISVNSVGNVNYGVQFYYDGFRMYRTGKYTLSFTASSDEPKGCEVRIQINGGDYHAYAIDTYTFTNEPKTYTMDFEMTEESDMTPRLCFNMGAFPDRDKGNLPCNVSLSNVSLTLNNTIVEETKGNGGADFVRVNQIGYTPDAKKIAYVKVENNGQKFSVVDINEKEVFTGKLQKAVREEKAYEYTAKADFTKFTTPGTYKIKVAENESYEFKIAENVYFDVLKDSLRFFTLSRCGTSVADDVFGHPACHTGKARIIGSNDYIEANGGWHDAGDYGRYVVAGAKAAVDLLLSYDSLGKDYSDFDILSEVKYELDWMLKMQRADGAVYHKITCLEFPPFVMPEEETEPLYISPISTPATADFAATMALASIYYRKTNPAFADTALEAAVKAWDFLETCSRPISFSNPSTVKTGSYSDLYDADDKYFAAAALCSATGSKKYSEAAEQLHNDKMARNWTESFGWAQMEGYADEIIVKNENLFSKELVASAKSALLKQADILMDQAKVSGFNTTVEKFVWGSNMEVCNNAHLLNIAYTLTGKENYRDIAREQVNYILGCNPMTECYVSGFGSHSPQKIHHRPSIAKGVSMKGMLVGGPDEKLEDAFAQNLLEDKPPMMCYLDNNQSFSTNEITIYWNSAFILALSELK